MRIGNFVFSENDDGGIDIDVYSDDDTKRIAALSIGEEKLYELLATLGFAADGDYDEESEILLEDVNEEE